MATRDSDKRKRRIAQIAAEIIATRINRGEIPCTDEAIQAAMPEAVAAARAAYDAAVEFIS